jgi:cytochrome P450
MISFKFSDGTVIPKGETLVAAMRPIHMDEEIYENPNQFNGFRFNELRERDGESARHLCTDASVEFLHFGLGHHIWQYIQSISKLMAVRDGFLR